MTYCDNCGNETKLIGSGYVEIDEIFEAGYDNKRLHLCRKCLVLLKFFLKIKEVEEQMSYIYCPEPRQKEIAERFNKLRKDIEDLIQKAFEELSSMLVVFEMFQDKMIIREREDEE